MNLLETRYLSMCVWTRIRGIVFHFLYFPYKCKGKLRVGRHVILRGDFSIGSKVNIESNVKITHHTILGNDILIGANVEFRGAQNSKICINDGTTINRNTLIIGQVTIGKNCSIAPNCVIAGSNHIFKEVHLPINKQGLSFKGITIEDNVWIGAGVIVVDGVTIGEGCVIGAASVITKNIPPYSVVVGNPYKIIRQRK